MFLRLAEYLINSKDVVENIIEENKWHVRLEKRIGRWRASSLLIGGKCSMAALSMCLSIQVFSPP
jgi:hypothetical protein